MRKGQNTFVVLLDLLKVKHTKLFSNKLFNEHPHKYNLFGLSEMLFKYGILNTGARIKDMKNDLLNIELPFVAHFGGYFVVVYKIESDKVYYLWNGIKTITPVSQFIQYWSGIVLLVEKTSNSIEPDYLEHRKKDLLNTAQRIVLAISFILIFGYAYINNVFSTHLEEFDSTIQYSVFKITSLLLINLIGFFFCYLLIQKQLKIQSRYADKICSLLSKSECNNVIETDAAKLWGVLGWSEIGLGYFLANVAVLLFFPQLITFLVIFNILTLPYTIWSIWYQKVKARQWCPLCLIVQVLLWTLFFINIVFGYINVQNILFHSHFSNLIFQLIIAVCIYAIPIFTLTIFIPKLSEGYQVEQLRQEINSIKSNEEMFITLLKQQTFFEVSKSDSQIIFGNPDAYLKITILTNPLCNPCAKMHVRLDKLIKSMCELHLPTQKTSICVQYIFSAFNEGMEYANRYFNAIYLEKGRETAWQLYSNWFEKGKFLEETFFKDLKLDMSNPEIELEFQRHKSWKEKTQLQATPTILINGYKIPENYNIEDIRYFQNAIIETTPKSR